MRVRRSDLSPPHQYIQAAWEFVDAERTGAMMVWGLLKEQRLPCTRDQVRRVISRLQPDAVAERTKRALKRRKYRAPYPNYVWHIDGHHKLCPQHKIVIHGGIDGHSHLIMFMFASDNNCAETVTGLFLEATQEYGWPQRVRADLGGENLGLTRQMVAARGRYLASRTSGISSRS